MSQDKSLSAPQIDTNWDPKPFNPAQHAATPTVVVSESQTEAQESTTGEPHASPGGFVRIELFLPPEQLAHFFRAVVATQHAIMTLREAAAYLRISANRLRALAEEGSVPAFLVEGHWRFSKQSVDEWTVLQRTTEEDSDAA